MFAYLQSMRFLRSKFKTTTEFVATSANDGNFMEISFGFCARGSNWKDSAYTICSTFYFIPIRTIQIRIRYGSMKSKYKFRLLHRSWRKIVSARETSSYSKQMGRMANTCNTNKKQNENRLAVKFQNYFVLTRTSSKIERHSGSYR